jgi:demethylmenaquinone methyltransferase/2-methoxy-6-polyprenyl-1,4-benzoquinol methylase
MEEDQTVEKNALDFSMHRYYEQRAPEYDDWYERRGRYNDPATNVAWHADVAELAREISRFSYALPQPQGLPTRVLDLACGTGKWTQYLARPLHDSGRVIAYDYSPAMLAETRARLEEDEADLLNKVFFVRGDAYCLPFKDETFDCVFFGFWLSHVPRERVAPFFNEVKRVLKPGGQVLIFDSLLMPGKPADNIQRRPLNDGSLHDVLKIYYTPETLQQSLSGIFNNVATGQTRQYFVIARTTR